MTYLMMTDYDVKSFLRVCIYCISSFGKANLIEGGKGI